MRFHTQTAGVSLTAQQPLNNIVRTAIEALAGVLGGTQSLHTNSYRRGAGAADRGGGAVALRTQQIIAEETGVANTIDPLGGSYFVEALTDRLEEPGLRVLRQDRRARRHGRGGQARLSRSARSPTPRSATSRRSRPASARSSASTPTPRATTRDADPAASIRRSSRKQIAPRARRCARAATAPRATAALAALRATPHATRTRT